MLHSILFVSSSYLKLNSINKGHLSMFSCPETLHMLVQMIHRFSQPVHDSVGVVIELKNQKETSLNLKSEAFLPNISPACGRQSHNFGVVVIFQLLQQYVA